MSKQRKRSSEKLMKSSRTSTNLKRNYHSESPEKVTSTHKKHCPKPIWDEIVLSPSEMSSDDFDDPKVSSIRACSLKNLSKDGRHRNAPNLTLDIPVLGLSTYRVRGYKVVHQALNAALSYGYRLFDTGDHYRNQCDIGMALEELLPQHTLNRDDISIITKLNPSCNTFADAIDCVERSLLQLRTDYLDICLLYWPKSYIYDLAQEKAMMMECYRALEYLHETKKCKHIGAYNFDHEQITYLLEKCSVVPSMLQAEFHPYNFQQKLVDICSVNAIRMQAYCFIKVIDDPVIIRLAHKHRKAPAQIVLRWIIQHGVGILPKSKTPAHIGENADIFDFCLDSTDMAMIDGLNRNKSYIRK